MIDINKMISDMNLIDKSILNISSDDEHIIGGPLNK